MYVGIIDNSIKQLIDDFYHKKIVSEKMIKKLENVRNFSQNLSEINSFFNSYFEKIDFKKIKNTFKVDQSIELLKTKIKKYLMFYFFLLVAFSYKGELKSFVNGIVDLQRKKNQFSFTSEEFFTTNSNSQIIELSYLVLNIKKIISTKNVSELEQRKDFQEALEIYRNNDEISKIEGKELTTRPLLTAHKIVFRLIFDKLYFSQERANLVNLLESIELNKGDYEIIEIVDHEREQISIRDIELLFGKEARKNVNLTNDAWQLLNDWENQVEWNTQNSNDKINNLINKGIIIPVVDNILLYHQSREKYLTEGKKNTKAQYIINKIDNAGKLYQDNGDINKDIFNKYFIPNMSYRKAIAINYFEDLGIVKKWVNRESNFEGQELAADLASHLDYPYANFDNFSSSGFYLTTNSSIPAVRESSIKKNENIKNPETYLDVITIPPKREIMITGFIISPINYLYCFKKSEVKNIRNIFKANNGYKLINSLINEKYFKNKPFNYPIYWNIQLNNDKITDEYSPELNFDNNNAKNLIANIHKSFTNQVYYYLIDKFKNDPNLTLDKVYQYINKIENKSIKIDRGSDLWNDLWRELFNKFIKNKIESKKSLRPIETFKLPDYSKPITYPKYFLIETNKEQLPSFKEIKKMGDGKCQHNITWNYIISLKNEDHQKYLDQLYEFFKKYVTTNDEGHFVCISCGFYLDVSNFVREGSFDDSGKFVPAGSYLHIELADMEGYKSYDKLINNLHLIIGRFADIINVPNISHGSDSIWIQKEIIKNSIDQITFINKQFPNGFNERQNNINSQYGINTNLTKLSPISLNNNIYQVSKFDDNFENNYKNIKKNNLMLYLIANLLVEINSTQIPFLRTDKGKNKLGSIPVFERFYQNIFSDLFLRINNKKETKPLTDFKVLCFTLFIISYRIARNNLWKHSVENPGWKEYAALQKLIIHSIIDLLNILIEEGEKDSSPSVITNFRFRFYQKLEQTYSNSTIYQTIVEKGSSSLLDKSSDYLLIKPENIEIKPRYPLKLHFPEPIHCRFPEYHIPTNLKKNTEYSSINNITNCPNGEFHDWHFNKDSNDMICSVCQQHLSKHVLNYKSSNELQNKFFYHNIREIAYYICLKGGYHYFKDNKEDSLCNKCNKTKNAKYSNSELDKIYNILKSLKEEKNNEKINSYLFNKKKIDSQLEYMNKIIEKQKNDNKTIEDNLYNFVEELKKQSKSNLQEFKNLLTNNYVLDHDYKGTLLDKKFHILGNSNKIKINKYDEHYKRDVIIITAYFNKNVKMFYDSIRLVYLGYKLDSSDYVDIKNLKRFLKVDYSTYNKLLNSGFNTRYIYLPLQYPDLYNKIERFNRFNKSKKEIIETILINLIRNRLTQLKEMINTFIKVYTLIKNNFQYSENSENEKQYDNLYKKYSGKFNNIIEKNETGKGSLFKHWRGIDKGLIVNRSYLRNLNIDLNDYLEISVLKIIYSDFSGNLLLNYFVSELKKLLSYNSEPLKSKIINFIVDFIDEYYDRNDLESLFVNPSYKNIYYRTTSDSLNAKYIEKVKQQIKEEENTKNYYSVEELHENLEELPESENYFLGTDYQDGMEEMAERFF